MKITTLLGAATLAAAGLMGSTVTADELKFAHVYEVSHPLHTAAVKAAELFEERTEGRHTIAVFPASSLGKEADLNEGLSLGTVDIIYTGAGFAGAVYGPASMTDFPFTLRNLAHWSAYYDSDVFAEVAKGYADATGGNEIAAVGYYGARHVTANKPILSPDDMKNLKIRVPNAPAYVLFPQATGANPTPMAFAEVYLALQQGVVDAQENPLTTIKAKRFHEVQDHINLTGHIINSIFTVVSSVRLSMLTDADRAILEEVLAETIDTATDEIVAAELELVEWFRSEGITVNEVDRAPFIEAVAPALTAGNLPFPDDLYEKLQSIPDAN
ncbi:sialic acid TRAP transporter substrate-binding protein SiaP [Tritonibacter horizontis]|uniref:Sialic acid-binding periplasmic protein SiaP n=1 Tax=Tritonibacter horizontis TaxID=1768241 RepID=A0A132C1S2_9RHOB|nr:sialic acid TRAP transporter substrate-binding protein SiaP [Tritonibacter horizontis]KUP94568.1 sialic acid-binding periplasmic protein SiaP precursor [Tritonibacter horizontis]